MTEKDNNLQKINYSGQDETVPFGVPFAVRTDGGLFQVIVWDKVTEDLRAVINFSNEKSSLLLPCDGYQEDKGRLVYFFNAGLKHCSVKEYVENLYVPSNVYCSIENESIALANGKYPKHSCLSMMKVVYAIAKWLEENTADLHMVVRRESAKEIASKLYQNLWLTDITITNKKHADEFQVLSLPVDKKVDDHIFLSDSFILDVLVEVSRQIFRIKPVNRINSDVVCEFFRPLGDFFNWIEIYGTNRQNVSVPPINNVSNFKTMLRIAINWFLDHTYWPEMRWKSNLTQNDIWSYSPERSIELRMSDKNTTEEICKRLNLTGTEIYNSDAFKTENTNELFKIKPILVSFEWDYDGLHMKLILNHIDVHRNVFEDLDIVSKRSPIRDHLSLIRELPNMTKEYLEKLVHLTKMGHRISKGMLLNNTYLRNRQNTICFDMSLYGLGSLVSPMHYTTRHGYPEGTKDFMRIVESEDEETSIVWEFGIFIVNIYQRLLRLSAKSCITGLNQDQRLFLKLYPCSEPFMIMIAYIMKLNSKTRPKLQDVLDSDFFNHWVEVNDLYLTTVIQENSRKCLERIKADLKLFPYYMVDLDELDSYRGEIVIDHQYKKYTDDDCIKIINSFTNFIPNKLARVPLVAKRDLPIVRMSMGTPDFAIGIGPKKDAIEMYCNAVNKLGLFTGKAEKCTLDNINGNIWFTLGFLIAHCMMRNIPMNLNLPRHLYKIMLEGPDADFTLNDLFFEDETLARAFGQLLFMSDTELEACELVWSNRLVKGPVTKDNVYLYVKDMIRYHFLRKYDIIDLRLLRDGFNVTPSEIPITTDILWKTVSWCNTPDPRVVLSLYNVVHTDSSGVFKEHGNNCLITYKNGKNVCYHAKNADKSCPLSEFAAFIRELDEDKLRKLIYFTTASSNINRLEKRSLFVTVCQLDETQEQLPTARTCTTHLFLYAKEMGNDWKKFRENLYMAIEESAFSME